MTKRKKPNKKRREELRKFHADTFNQGFTHAWNLREQEVQYLKKQLEIAEREIRKISGVIGGYK